MNAISATELTPKNMQIMKMVCSIARLPVLPDPGPQYTADTESARFVTRETVKMRYISV